MSDFLQHLKSVDLKAYRDAVRYNLADVRDFIDFYAAPKLNITRNLKTKNYLLNIAFAYIIKLPKKLTSNYLEQEYNLTLHGISASSILKNQLSTLSFGNDDFDRIFNGGIHAGMITEICGESGTGKTQLCLQILANFVANTSYQSNKDTAIYIYTQGTLRTDRLLQLLEGNVENENKCLDRILSLGISDLTTQNHILSYSLEPQIVKHGVKLVILDSFAANIREGGSCSTAEQRSKYQSISNLKRLAFKYGLYIVVTNEMTANINRYDPILNTNLYYNPVSARPAKEWAHDSIPSLGMHWSNMVSCRILLSNIISNYLPLDGISPKVRKFELIFSPFSKKESCKYTITQNGVTSI